MGWGGKSTHCTSGRAEKGETGSGNILEQGFLCRGSSGGAAPFPGAVGFCLSSPGSTWRYFAVQRQLWLVQRQQEEWERKIAEV